jgi:hypothetical protein
LFWLERRSDRTADLLQSSRHLGGAARRDRRRETLQRTMGLPLRPLVLPAMLDVAYWPAVMRMDHLHATFPFADKRQVIAKTEGRNSHGTDLC